AGNLLRGEQDGFGPAQVHEDVAPVNPPHHPGDDVPFPVGEFLVNQAPLRFPDALDHHLPRRLGGDAAEVLRGDFQLDLVAHLGIGIDAPGFLQIDFQAFVADLVDYLFPGDDADVAPFPVDLDLHQLGGAEVSPVGGNQGRLQGFDQSVHIDAAFPLQGFQGADKFKAQFSLPPCSRPAFRRPGGDKSGCRRTRCTWWQGMAKVSPSGPVTTTLSSTRPPSLPSQRRRPSTGSRAVTSTSRPLKYSNSPSFFKTRSRPGEATSNV